MLVLARVLTPEDFGIVAIVTSIVYLFDNLTQTGAQQYIIRKDIASKEDLNTCFTLNFILKVSAWLILLTSIPFIVNYLNDDRLALPLIAMSFVILALAFQNPGIYLLERELQYSKITKLAIYAKLISFLSVMIIAFIFRTYWAMVAGVLIFSTIQTLGSYIIHEHKPQFRVSELKRQWLFSRWIFFKGIIGYVRYEFDTFLVTRQFGLESVGGYNMMKNLSLMPASDVIVPLTKPLLSSFSSVKNDSPTLIKHFNVSLLVLGIVIFPIISFVYSNATSLISVLLGTEWTKYSTILEMMMLLFLSVSFGSVLTHVFTAMGRVRMLFLFDAFTVAIIIGTLLLSQCQTLEEFAFLRTTLGVLSAALLLAICVKTVGASLKRVIILNIPAFLNATVSFYACSYIDLGHELTTLIARTAIAFIIYGCLTILFMRLLKNVREFNVIWGLIPKKYRFL